MKRGPKTPQEQPAALQSCELVPPAWMTGIALETFREVAAELSQAGAIRPTDSGLVEAYALARAGMIESEKDMAANGAYYTSKAGYECARPCVQRSETCANRMNKLASTLGLGVLSRKRAGMQSSGQEQETDPTEEFTR